MTMYVIFVDGRIARTNDENPSPMLFASRRHAARVIRWLGLTLTRIAEATEEQIAEGDFCEAKSDDE